MSQTISNLVDGRDMDEEVEVQYERREPKEVSKKMFSWGKKDFLHYLIYFIVVAIIVYLIFYFLKFDFVQSRDSTGALTGNLDQSKAIIWSIVIALIFVLLVYLLTGHKGNVYEVEKRY
jgi:flagellar biosynthesis protein FlhB